MIGFNLISSLSSKYFIGTPYDSSESNPKEDNSLSIIALMNIEQLGILK